MAVFVSRNESSDRLLEGLLVIITRQGYRLIIGVIGAKSTTVTSVALQT